MCHATIHRTADYRRLATHMYDRRGPSLPEIYARCSGMQRAMNIAQHAMQHKPCNAHSQHTTRSFQHARSNLRSTTCSVVKHTPHTVPHATLRIYLRRCCRFAYPAPTHEGVSSPSGSSALDRPHLVPHGMGMTDHSAHSSAQWRTGGCGPTWRAVARDCDPHRPWRASRLCRRDLGTWMYLCAYSPAPRRSFAL